MERSENFVFNDIRQPFDRPIELEVIKWTVFLSLKLLMQLLAYDFDITDKDDDNDDDSNDDNDDGMP